MLSEIFKAYDVRGIYGKDLTDEVAYRIGKAFVSFLKCREVIVGYDMRLSSPKLANEFAKGASELGADVIDIGMVSTDALYFASGFLEKPAVMFTASHNPGSYNGIKFCREKAIPINFDTGLNKIKQIIEKGDFGRISGNAGKISKKNILDGFVGHVRKFADVSSLKKLKIAVDAGNGMAGKMVPLAYKNLPVKIIPLYFKLDGAFPNHPADPSKYENLKDLQEVVIREKCDFGMAFDGDADRIFFIDEKGRICNSSLISCLIIKNLLKEKRHAGIIYNLVCSKIVPETIEKFGGKAIMERVGHSYIKDTMRKTGAVFACEHSAHYYYKDNFNADSGIISSMIVSGIVSKENKKLSSLLEEFRRYHKIEETNFKVEDKKAAMESIEKHYKRQKPKKILKLDGITVEFKDWWFNVRPSNTEPLLRLNLEAKSKEIVAEKLKEIEELLAPEEL